MQSYSYSMVSFINARSICKIILPINIPSNNDTHLCGITVIKKYDYVNVAKHQVPSTSITIIAYLFLSIKQSFKRSSSAVESHHKNLLFIGSDQATAIP